MEAMEKNPVSMLNEMKQGKKILSYSLDDVKETGPDHEKVFEAHAVVTDCGGKVYEASRKGLSRKDAQRYAAKAVLQSMGVIEVSNCECDTEYQPTKYNPGETPVSYVFRYAQQNRFDRPAFKTVAIEGPAHDRTFTEEIRFKDRVATGSGKSKQEAKNNAAQKLIDDLGL